MRIYNKAIATSLIAGMFSSVAVADDFNTVINIDKSPSSSADRTVVEYRNTIQDYRSAAMQADGASNQTLSSLEKVKEAGIL